MVKPGAVLIDIGINRITDAGDRLRDTFLGNEVRS